MAISEEARASILQSCRAKIAEHGHMVAAIGAGDDRPQFAYTIGLTSVCGAEFAVSGLEAEDMHNILNKIGRRVRAGELRPSDKALIEGVLEGGYVLRLRPAHPSWSFPWIAAALELEAQPPIWQVQFPARDGRWPGDPGCDLHPYDQTDFTLPCDTEGP